MAGTRKSLSSKNKNASVPIPSDLPSVGQAQGFYCGIPGPMSVILTYMDDNNKKGGGGDSNADLDETSGRDRCHWQ